MRRPSAGNGLARAAARAIVADVEIVLHDDADTFAELAGPVLRADPLRHTIALGVLDAVHRGGERASVLLTVHEAGRVTAAALRTPGRLALVSAVPPRLAPPVERALADADPDVPGVSGPLAEAEAVAAARSARTGVRAAPLRRTRLFALDALVVPSNVPGAPRRAGADDVALLGRWRQAFEREAGSHSGWSSPAAAQEHVARALRLGAAEVLWEVDGTPVAHAAARPVLAGATRIGPVYTPPEHRGHGYAAAVTAAVSRWALAEGAQRVLLFTDLANATTNRLYPRLGYRPVHDAVELGFHAGR